MTVQAITIKWQPRFEPLRAAALIAFGTAASGLKTRLLGLSDEKLRELQGVFGDELLFVAGDDLPWVDGVIYLGKDPRAPSMYLPTNLQPNVPVDIFCDALIKRFAEHLPFVAVENRIVPVGAMRPVSRAILNDAL